MPKAITKIQFINNLFAPEPIKPFVIGRKNWMFSDSVAGVKDGQIIYSIIEICIANKVEPYAYLRYQSKGWLIDRLLTKWMSPFR